jgi:hypothetical protein
MKTQHSSPENHAVYEIKWKKYGTAGQATDDNTMHAFCVLDNDRYNHRLRICNNFCFWLHGRVSTLRYTYVHIVRLV